MSRPAGSTGAVRQALLDAAAEVGTVRQIAERAQVGYDLARCTVSRMIDAGELLVLDERRPALVVAATSVVAAEELADA
jgi:alkylation response protein AidB-like acyl-CoA dehydrogenase